MKRLLFIAVFWGAALLPVAVQAQRGMGFRGSAAPPARTNSGFAARPAGVPSAGFASRPSGFGSRPSGFGSRPVGFGARPGTFFRPAPTFSSMGRVRTSSGMRVVSPRSHVFISTRSFFPHHRHFHHFATNPLFFSHSCFNGFFDPFCRNPFFFGSSFIGPFDPFFSGFSTPAVEQQQPVVVEQDSNSRELALEVQELSDEIQSMREEDRAREDRRNASNKPVVQDFGPDTVFIFRDGLQLSAKNYAVAGDTLWVLDEHKAKKIPMSKLDIPATEQANAKNGVELHLTK